MYLINVIYNTRRVVRKLRRILSSLLEFIVDFPHLCNVFLLKKPLYSLHILKSHNKTIVFISESPRWREAKLAYGLKNAGWDVILMHQQPPAFKNKDSFCEVINYASPWQAVDIALSLKGKIYHNFTNGIDKTTHALSKKKPGKIILDVYDYIYSIEAHKTYSSKNNIKNGEIQFKCLEAADAISCRDLQLSFNRSNTLMGKGKPLIIFPEYCWNQVIDSPVENKIGGVAQIGTFSFENQGEFDNGNLMIANAITSAGIDFHIYLHPFFPRIGSVEFKKLFAEYIELGERTKRVYFHDFIDPNDLTSTLSSHDWGLSAINGTCFTVPWTSTSLERVSLLWVE